MYSYSQEVLDIHFQCIGASTCMYLLARAGSSQYGHFYLGAQERAPLATAQGLYVMTS